MMVSNNGLFAVKNCKILLRKINIYFSVIENKSNNDVNFVFYSRKEKKLLPRGRTKIWKFGQIEHKNPIQT